MSKQLTYSCFIEMNGITKNFDDLTQSEREHVLHRMSENLSKSMSEYYAQNPELIENL